MGINIVTLALLRAVLYCSGSPAEFSSNSIQTQLNKLIKVFRIARNLQTGEFDQGQS